MQYWVQLDFVLTKVHVLNKTSDYHIYLSVDMEIVIVSNAK